MGVPISDISWGELERILARVTEVSLDAGTADSGSTTVIRDTSKNWATNMWTDAIAHAIIGTTEHVRRIASNTATDITVDTALGATCVSGTEYAIRRLATRISGELVLAHVYSGVVAAHVSGSVRVSGTVAISGQVNILSGQVSVSSGLVGILSGQVSAQVSGAVAVSGVVGVSGQVSVESGQIAVSSGRISVSSGDISARISGAVQVSGVVGVSGQVQVLSGEVSVSSGEIHVISGQLIAKVSGETVSLPASQVIKVSGEATTMGRYMPVEPTVASGQIAAPRIDVTQRLLVAISGEAVDLVTETLAISSGLVGVLSGQVSATVSGAVQVSGVLGVSGQVQILSGQVSVSSGEIHVVSGQLIAKVSGETVSLPASQVIKVSGETITTASGSLTELYVPIAVRTGALLVPTAGSGGSAFGAKACKSATVKSLSGDLWVGGTAAGDMPYSGYGFLLTAGEAASLDIDDFSRIRVCANVSGNWASAIGVN